MSRTELNISRLSPCQQERMNESARLRRGGKLRVSTAAADGSRQGGRGGFGFRLHKAFKKAVACRGEKLKKDEHLTLISVCLTAAGAAGFLTTYRSLQIAAHSLSVVVTS